MRFSRWFHWKSKFSFSTLKSDHQWHRFPSKCAQSWKTLKNACFWHCIVIIEWSRFFPGNPAVSLFFLYHPLTWCKKAKKSSAWFSAKIEHGRTDGRTDRILGLGLNWSWELQRAIALVSTSVTLENLRTLQTFSECKTLIEQML